ncbi:S-layer homology domain-containing protein [Pseudoneobacillus rhizosphaerae]|nr:S-layer homology domain-containing protein [Pseudoneobacillus rhizosphaerae]
MRYPFSKKAIASVLAATVALSPILTTGMTLQPLQVEAATSDNSSVDSLISYLDSIYAQVADKEALKVVKAELAKQDWNAYAEQIASKPVAHPTENKQLLASIMELFANTTVLDLTGKLETFKTAQKDNVTTVFGSDVTVDMLLTYIAMVETNYLNSLIGLDVSKISETTVYLKFVDAVFMTENTSAANKLVGTKFFGLVDSFQVLHVLQKVSKETDPNGVARNELISALNKLQSPTDPGTLPVTPPEHTTEPIGLTEIVKETAPNGKNIVVTKILDTKVNELLNLITPTNQILPINLEIPTAGETVKALIPGKFFTEAAKKNPNTIIEIKAEGASYKLPISQIKVEDLAAKLGVSATNLQITVSVNTVERPEIQKGIKVLSKVVEFTVEAVSGNKKESIHTFTEYVARTIVGERMFDSNKSTAVKINANGSVSSVPTLFDNKTATLHSLTNSTYTVVENNFTFPDVDNKKNWAEDYIETLANKLIINGKPNGSFAPSEEMTRAQFTVLLVKALALPGEKYEQKFKDVKASDWFNLNGELAAAIKYGIIAGKPDGSFAPNEKVTRAQAAIMFNRAMKLGFIKYDMTKLDKTKRITDFLDVAKMNQESKLAIEAIYQAGIINGKPDSTFDPGGKTRRDQMAKMLAEFLISAKLMNEIK